MPSNVPSMKWVITNSKKALLQEYQLLEQGGTKAIVKYNPVQRSARISVGDSHRLFFIESAGSLTGKYIFKNEYGLEVGTMANDRWSREGSVTIESKKFIYKIQPGTAAELTIYDGSTNKILASCSLATGINGTSLALSEQTNNAGSNYLLLGLCWFLFLPTVKETAVEYAA